MTLIFGSPTHQGNAKTHALVIGVGRYPYLVGGPKFDPSLPMLAQLTSPPISARALADWLINHPNANPDAPLGSIELVLSQDDQGVSKQQYGTHNVADATFDGIQSAFSAWFARCDAHQNNTALFYFCGHGVQGAELVLLPEDFGSTPNNPWLKAIDFDRSYRGMAQCQAPTQIFVIDACRQVSHATLPDLDFGGQTLKRALVTNLRPRTAPALFATALGRAAFGDTGQVSHMTQALLDCLNGLGADRKNGRWQVDSDHLGIAVQKLVKFRNLLSGTLDPQIVDPSVRENALGNFVLHVLPPGNVPEVFVTVACHPDALTPTARFYAKPLAGKPIRAQEIGAWSTRLKAGHYEFGCRLNEGGNMNPMEEFIRPPVDAITVRQ